MYCEFDTDSGKQAKILSAAPSSKAVREFLVNNIVDPRGTTNRCSVKAMLDAHSE